MSQSTFDNKAYWRVRLNTFSSIMFAVAAVVWLDTQIWFTGGLLLCSLFYGIAARRDRRAIADHEATLQGSVPAPAHLKLVQRQLVNRPLFCDRENCRK